MDAILKKANCCSGNIYNEEIVAKIMDVLINMNATKSDSGLYKKLDTKFKTIKSEFFTQSRFPEINHWSLQRADIFTMAKYNIAIYSIQWGGAYSCPFKTISPDKNNLDNNYDGYDFGNVDIILYNLANKEHIIMNTWHIHALYYHNNFGNETFKIDLEKLITVLQPVTSNKITITCKNELVYDNIITMAHNDAKYIMDHKPQIASVDDKLIVISALIKKSDDYDFYNTFIKTTAIKKKSGDPVIDKELLHIAIFDKNYMSIQDGNGKINLTDISAYHIALINKYFYEACGFKLVIEAGLYKYNLVNKCFPIMKDIYYYKFE